MEEKFPIIDDMNLYVFAEKIGNLIDIIVENYDSKYHKTFLEIGCGDGRFFDTAFKKLKELKF